MWNFFCKGYKRNKKDSSVETSVSSADSLVAALAHASSGAESYALSTRFETLWKRKCFAQEF